MICTSRQLGKTTILLMYCIAFALRNPRTTTFFLAPLLHQLEGYILPRMNVCLSFLPEDCIPNRRALTWTFPNGAVLRCEGGNASRGARIRGNSISLAVIDECRDFADLEQLITNHLSPALATTDGQIVMISTPPTTPAHVFTSKYIAEAIKTGDFFSATYRDNPLISTERLRYLMNVQHPGGETNPVFRREYLADYSISDDAKRVTPEFDEATNAAFFTDYKGPPEVVRPYLSMDFAFHDPCGMIASYLDPIAGAMIITDEWQQRGMNTDQVGEKLVEMEKRLVDSLPNCAEAIRIMDVDPSLAADLYLRFKLVFEPCHKTANSYSMLSKLRVAIADGRIRIHPRCEELIFQLKSGVFNEKDTDYVRTTRSGHLDLVDCLKYLCLNARWTEIFPPPAPTARRGEILIPDMRPSGSFRGGLVRR